MRTVRGDVQRLPTFATWLSPEATAIMSGPNTASWGVLNGGPTRRPGAGWTAMIPATWGEGASEGAEALRSAPSLLQAESARSTATRARRRIGYGLGIVMM